MKRRSEDQTLMAMGTTSSFRMALRVLKIEKLMLDRHGTRWL